MGLLWSNLVTLAHDNNCAKGQHDKYDANAADLVDVAFSQNHCWE